MEGNRHEAVRLSTTAVADRFTDPLEGGDRDRKVNVERNNCSGDDLGIVVGDIGQEGGGLE